MGYLTEEEQNLVRMLIDHGAWKHSWHLPQTHWGSIDWYNPKTIQQCRDVLEEYRTDWIRLASQADNMLARIKEHQKRHTEDEVESP